MFKAEKDQLTLLGSGERVSLASLHSRIEQWPTKYLPGEPQSAHFLHVPF